MKKMFIGFVGIALGAMLSLSAVAAEKSLHERMVVPGIELGLDSFYKVDSEVFYTEPSVVVSVNNFYGGVTPTVNVTNSDVEAVEFEAGYVFNPGIQNFTVTPYVRVVTDGDFERSDTDIGVSARLRF